jgi:hypothetical protein
MERILQMQLGQDLCHLGQLITKIITEWWIQRIKPGLGYSLMAECLPSMLEVPGSIPSTAKKKKNKN